MTIKGMRSLKRKVRGMNRDLGRRVEKAVAEGATSTAAEARAQVLTGGQVWRGLLAQSIYVRETFGPSGKEVRIVADTPYAAYVEFGTGARFGVSPYGVPDDVRRFDSPELTPGLVSAITNWVMTKPGFMGPRTQSMAWAIAKSIAKRGTNAHPYMRPAWFATKPEMMRKARRAVKRSVRRN
jgi:HK97 gp10 family phage protein